MDIIRNYLETMFAGLPDTPQVRRARTELGEMMEDKYTELLAEGRSENEAIGTVISEFGNLEELSAVLGIEDCIREHKAVMQLAEVGKEKGGRKSAADDERIPEEEPLREEERKAEVHHVCLQEAQDYLAAARQASVYRATAVFLCIISPVLLFFGNGRGLFEALAAAVMFVLIAAAVVFLILAGNLMRPWKYLKRGSCSLENETREYLEYEQEEMAQGASLLKSIGIVLCLFSIAPVIIFDVFGGFLMALGPAAMFVIAGFGIAMMIRGISQTRVYKKLLRMNGAERARKRRGRRRRVRHTGERLRKISELLLPVYWETVTAVYLCVSFLTFGWGVTWIIWVIAAALKKYLDSRYRIEVNAHE